MDKPITDSESLSEAPQSFVPPEPSSDRWTEVSFSTEGVGITLYEESEDGPRVVDETWLTRDELVNALAEGRTVTLK